MGKGGMKIVELLSCIITIYSEGEGKAVRMPGEGRMGRRW